MKMSTTVFTAGNVLLLLLAIGIPAYLFFDTFTRSFSQSGAPSSTTFENIIMIVVPVLSIAVIAASWILRNHGYVQYSTPLQIAGILVAVVLGIAAWYSIDSAVTAFWEKRYAEEDSRIAASETFLKQFPRTFTCEIPTDNEISEIKERFLTLDPAGNTLSQVLVRNDGSVEGSLVGTISDNTLNLYEPEEDHRSWYSVCKTTEGKTIYEQYQTAYVPGQEEEADKAVRYSFPPSD